MPIDLEQYKLEIRDHRNWLVANDEQLAKQWDDRLKSDDEAAIVEALTRRNLEGQVSKIWPHEHPSSGGPDFGCESCGQRFLIECTAFRQETATKKTGLPDRPGGAQHYRPMHEQIIDKVKKKAGQIQSQKSPVLLAIGTLHYQAGGVLIKHLFVEWNLTGPSSVFGGPERSKSVFYKANDLRQGIPEPARRNVSGVVLLDLSGEQSCMRGIVHPAPARKFNTRWLPATLFCQFLQPQDVLCDEVEWVQGDPPECIASSYREFDIHSR